MKLEQRVLEYLHLMARTPLVTGALRHPVLAVGEQLAAQLTASYLNLRHRPATVIDPRNLIIASPQPGARFKLHITDDTIRSRILDPLKTGTTPVIPGFYARTPGGRIITLGRGGSDLSAALLAATLKATELQIWTDVPGLRTGDPELITTTRPVPLLPYELALIIARIGAKRFHPEALEPVAREKIPTRITSPGSSKHAGTLIAPDIRPEPGPLLITQVHPVIYFRFTWTSLPPPTVGEFMNDLHHAVRADFIAFAERPPCVHGYLITHTPSSRRVLKHLAERWHADLQFDEGALVGIVGYNLALEVVKSILKHHPRAFLLPWVTDTFIPLWAPPSIVQSLIQDLHRDLFESPPSGPPHGAASKPRAGSQNAQKHSKMLPPFQNSLQAPFARSGFRWSLMGRGVVPRDRWLMNPIKQDRYHMKRRFSWPGPWD